MSQYFGFSRKKGATVAPAGANHITSTFATGYGRVSSRENHQPAAKIAAIEKPGQSQPARRVFGDLTNANSNAKGLNVTKGLKTSGVTTMSVATGIPSISTKPNSKRPDAILHSLRSSNTASFVTKAPTVTVHVHQQQQQQQHQHKQESLLEESQPTVEPMAIDEVPQTKEPVEDIDAFDAEDPQFCSDYVMEIYEYLREKEVTDRVDPNYMQRQLSINSKMRAILVNWLVDVHLRFRLLTETLFLSVNIFDKFLQHKQIEKDQLQLVGITAVLIASKFEETFPVDIADLEYASDNAYSRQEITRMERVMLTQIGFTLSSPSPLHFLRRFSKAAKNDGHMHTLAKFIIEYTLIEASFLEFLPSEIAAASVWLSRKMLRSPPYWTPTLEFYTGYTVEELTPCARELNRLISNPKPRLLAVRKKYTSSKLGSVALVSPLTESF